MASGTKPKDRYTQQRCQAVKRNIDWHFTFETWWKMWSDSGKWEQRGRKAGQYCMARNGDIGPYSPDNVDIVTVEQNSADGNKGKIGSTRGKTMEEFYGKKRADEIKEKLRQANLGKPQSAATRKKKSDANKKPWSKARRDAYLNSQ